MRYILVLVALLLTLVAPTTAQPISMSAGVSTDVQKADVNPRITAHLNVQPGAIGLTAFASRSGDDTSLMGGPSFRVTSGQRMSLHPIGGVTMQRDGRGTVSVGSLLTWQTQGALSSILGVTVNSGCEVDTAFRTDYNDTLQNVSLIFGVGYSL